MSSKCPLTRTAMLAAAAVIAAATATSSALAQMARPDDQAFMLYHQAIYAAAHCEGRNFYQSSAFSQNWRGDSARAAQSAQARMAEVIGSKTGHGMRNANSLSLIEQAKADARVLIFREGCQGSNVQTLLGLFHSDLAPAL
ncbi:MAG: hypothetical protein ACFCUQ_18975 [Kiloniellales bacterium]